MTVNVFQELISPSLEDQLQKGIAYAMSLGADGAEAYVSVSRSHKAKVQNGHLEDVTTSKRGGLGVRVIHQGRTGLATTSHLTRPDFNDLFEKALGLSKLGDPDPWNRQAEPSGQDDLPSRYDAQIETLDTQTRIDYALQLEAFARQSSDKVCAIRESAWKDGVSASLLLTQKGVRAADVACSCSASIELAVESGLDRQAAWHFQLERQPNSMDLKKIGQEAALKGLRKLGAKPLKAGRYPVVLHPEVAVDILGLVAEMLSGEEVAKQRSLFANMLGQSIAASKLTLIDDGRLVHSNGQAALGSEAWDGEGLPTRRNVLIENGVLKSYLHTLRSAAEMKQEATANAGRGMGSNPSPTSSNLMAVPGTQSPEALYQMAGTGVLITEIMGLHTVDPVSGDMSVGASGIMIRDGQLAESVDRMTFAGNLTDFLKGIQELGSDLKWYGSQAGLSILLSEVALGGA